MKKNILTYLSLLLAIVMLVSALAACNGPETPSEATTDETVEGTETVSETPTDSDEESNTDQETGDETESNAPASIENIENGLLIENAYALSNGVNAYFKDGKRTEFLGVNQNMVFEYGLAGHYDQQLTYLKNTNGNSYIENTFDVFVKMKNGNTFYASKSSVSTTANLYRFGYYYYDIRLEEQDFFNGVYEIEAELPVTLEKIAGSSQIKVSPIDNGDGKSAIKVEVSRTDDPYLVFADIEYSAEDYQYLQITMKSNSKKLRSFQIYARSSKSGGYYESNNFLVQPDDEYHTYTIPIGEHDKYEGTISGLRIDFGSSCERGESFEISEVKVIKGNDGGAPRDLSIARDFLVYSDKMHHYVQVASDGVPTTDIESVGMETRISTDTVAKLVVKDASGLHYSLDEVDWNTAEYAGFDIIDAGIFGYILPADNSGGKLEIIIDAETNEYVLIQSRAPENGTIVNSAVLNADTKKYVHIDGVEDNGNDFFMGQRIYTDENHDFDAFLYEANIERNPLTDANINVIEVSSTNGEFLGYDAIRGIYKFYVDGTGFNQPYFTVPNKHYNVTFEIKGDEYDRDIYIMSYYSGGCLECAVLLDQDRMMLPVPIEVGKNFSEGSGERNLWNVDDLQYSEAIIPMVIKAGSKDQYTLLNLYQNWGKYPLKQVSWIQFYAPYYHLSTGVTETNCIVPYYSCKNARGLGTLPDHRAMSAPLWAGQPQHNSGGSHIWLVYTDADGVYSASENTLNTVGSYGPIYGDVTSYYTSDDGNIKVSYNHMEFPQTDENRAYYEMKYEVVGDVSFKDFVNDFQFYRVGPNDSKGHYQRIGYLDTSNEYQVVETKLDGTSQKIVLGDNCPYFSFFYMPDWNRESTSAEGYTNLSFLIYNYEFVIGGEKITPNFCIVNKDNKVYLTLDLEEVTLKAGDTFTINAIVMPWGAQDLDNVYDDNGNLLDDVEKGVYYYDSIVNEATGEKYNDKNVRDVRENSLLNPFKAIAVENCSVMESVFLPKVKSADGKSATFTLTGGYNNCAVRVYGFDKLTVPYIEELVTNEDGEQVWQEYVVCSAWTQDKMGNGAYYDGYSVHYDLDGTFSYAFIVEMDGENDRTFRVSAEKDFDRWPKNLPVMPKEETPLDAYVDVNDLWAQAKAFGPYFGSVEVSNDGCLVLTSNSERQESYFNGYDGGTEATGQYFVMKYRLPSTNNRKYGYLEFFASTVDASAASRNQFSISKGLINDGEWHVLVIDLASWGKSCIAPADDGTYKLNFVRLDIFNEYYTDGNTFELEYTGLDATLEDIFEYNKDMSHVILVGKDIYTTYDPTTGEVIDNLEDVAPQGGSSSTETKAEGFTKYFNAAAVGNAAKTDSNGGHTGGTVTSADGSYVTLSLDIARNRVESFFSLFKNNSQATGQYLLIQYRTSTQIGYMEIYASTEVDNATAAAGLGGNTTMSAEKGLFIADGEWHTIALDLSEMLKDTAFAPNENGEYIAQFLRLDLFNLTDVPSEAYSVDIGYIGMCDNYEDAICHDTTTLFYDTKLQAVSNTGDVVEPPKPAQTVISGDLTSSVAGYNLYLNATQLRDKSKAAGQGHFGKTELLEDNAYARFYNCTDTSRSAAHRCESYFKVYDGDGTKATGQYLVIKYRAQSNSGSIQIYTSTTSASASGEGTVDLSQGKGLVIGDGEWHILIVDLSKITKSFLDVNGKYAARHLRVDLFNFSNPVEDGSEPYVDLAYVGMTDDYNEIIGKDTSVGEIHFYDGGEIVKIPTK